MWSGIADVSPFIDESHFTPQFSNFLSEMITDRLFSKMKIKRAKPLKLSDRSKSKFKNGHNEYEDHYPLW